MPSFLPSRHIGLAALLAATLTPSAASAQDVGPAPHTAVYDKAIFLKPLAPDQAAFLKQFAGASSGEAMQDKQFRKLLRNIVPDVMFHYGSDMPLRNALDSVFKNSAERVQLRDDRYLTLSGHSGPYLAGRAFLWIDLQEGDALGVFYFHPTNGEPTPSVTVFSRQIKEDALSMAELPPAFVEDLARWAGDTSVPSLTTRYFIGDARKKLLLEHDNDYCKPATTAEETMGDCEQENADAADIDFTAASYLDATHHATNGTAWMISGEDQAWLRVRDNTCGVALPCRIRLTRERTHIILKRPPHR